MADRAEYVGFLEDLVTSVEIAAMIGKSRQRLHQMVKEGKFPPPMGRVGNRLVWQAAEVDSWVQRNAAHPRGGRDTR